MPFHYLSYQNHIIVEMIDLKFQTSLRIMKKHSKHVNYKLNHLKKNDKFNLDYTLKEKERNKILFEETIKFNVHEKRMKK
jgi:hypothetical protein